MAACVVSLLAFAAVAWGYSEYYGGYNICGSNCYIQSSGAHTFTYNATASGGGVYMACQLFNNSGYNQVQHGYQLCGMNATPDAYKWARGYNQSGSTQVVQGYAQTN